MNYLHYRPFKEDFIGFLGKVFTTVRPGQPFQMNWHLELIAAHLMALQSGEINRLIINLPPRSLKSVTVSVAWPAWLLGHMPETRILAASYSQPLSNRHSTDCRLILQSEWYRQLFPDTQLSHDQNEKHKFVTTARGMRLATSIWGTLTGEGGDWLIADDPMNPLQARSAAMRRMVRDWFDHTFSTRLDDKKQGKILIVMQRLHTEDVCGHLLAKGGWELCSLPAIAEQNQRWDIHGQSFSRSAGSLLHETREDEASLARAQRELGAAHFAAQYQQSPMHEAGGLFKREWFVRC